MADIMAVLKELIANYELEAEQIAADPNVPTNEVSDDVRDPENDSQDTAATPEETAEVQQKEEEIVTAPTIDKDLVLVTAEDMAEQTVEMRLSEFKHRLDEMESTINATMELVSGIQNQFRQIDASIDQTRIISPSVKAPRDYKDILTAF